LKTIFKEEIEFQQNLKNNQYSDLKITQEKFLLLKEQNKQFENELQIYKKEHLNLSNMKYQLKQTIIEEENYIDQIEESNATYSHQFNQTFSLLTIMKMLNEIVSGEVIDSTPLVNPNNKPFELIIENQNNIKKLFSSQDFPSLVKPRLSILANLLQSFPFSDFSLYLDNIISELTMFLPSIDCQDLLSESFQKHNSSNIWTFINNISPHLQRYREILIILREQKKIGDFLSHSELITSKISNFQKQIESILHKTINFPDKISIISNYFSQMINPFLEKYQITIDQFKCQIQEFPKIIDQIYKNIDIQHILDNNQTISHFPKTYPFTAYEELKIKKIKKSLEYEINEIFQTNQNLIPFPKDQSDPNKIQQKIEQYLKEIKQYPKRLEIILQTIQKQKKLFDDDIVILNHEIETTQDFKLIIENQEQIIYTIFPKYELLIQYLKVISSNIGENQQILYQIYQNKEIISQVTEEDFTNYYKCQTEILDNISNFLLTIYQKTPLYQIILTQSPIDSSSSLYTLFQPLLHNIQQNEIKKSRILKELEIKKNNLTEIIEDIQFIKEKEQITQLHIEQNEKILHSLEFQNILLLEKPDDISNKLKELQEKEKSLNNELSNTKKLFEQKIDSFPQYINEQKSPNHQDIILIQNQINHIYFIYQELISLKNENLPNQYFIERKSNILKSFLKITLHKQLKKEYEPYIEYENNIKTILQKYLLISTQIHQNQKQIKLLNNKRSQCSIPVPNEYLTNFQEIQEMKRTFRYYENQLLNFPNRFISLFLNKNQTKIIFKFHNEFFFDEFDKNFQKFNNNSNELSQMDLDYQNKPDIKQKRELLLEELKNSQDSLLSLFKNQISQYENKFEKNPSFISRMKIDKIKEKQKEGDPISLFLVFIKCLSHEIRLKFLSQIEFKRISSLFGFLQHSYHLPYQRIFDSSLLYKVSSKDLDNLIITIQNRILTLKYEKKFTID
jgi:hypothetical protein